MLQLPLADIDLRVIFGIVMFAIYALNHLFNAAKEKQGEKPIAPPKPPPVDPQAEVEQFLRQAAEMRRAQAQPAGQKRAVRPPRPKEAKRPAAGRPGAPLRQPKEESIAARVERKMSSQEFDSRAMHLTDDLTQADRDRARHMATVFEHRLGTLADTTMVAATQGEQGASAQTESTATKQSNQAQALLTQLVDPQNLRQAIILQEILTRPEDRW